MPPPERSDVGEGSSGRIRALLWPLRQPGLRRLVSAFLVNELGDGITRIVLPLAVYAATDSGILTGLSFAVVRGSALVGAPVGGLLADRTSRLTVLRVSFVVRALLLALALVVDRQAVTLVCLLLVSLGGTVDNPAAEAAVRERAGDRLQSVATIRQVARAFSALVGPAVGGLLVSLFDTDVAVAVDLATFVVAALLLRPGLASLAPPDPTDDVAPASTTPTVPASDGLAAMVRGMRDDVLTGVRHLASESDLRLVVFARAVNGVLVMALLTAAVVYLGDLPGAPDGAYGYAVATYSTGSLVGLVVAGAIAWRSELSAVVTRSLVVYGVLCVVGVSVPDWRLLAVSWLAWGLTRGPEQIVTDVVLVAHTDGPLLGRTYAGVNTVLAAGQVFGSLLGGVLADVIGPRLVMAGLALAFLPAAAWVWWTRRRPAVRQPG